MMAWVWKGHCPVCGRHVTVWRGWGSKRPERVRCRHCRGFVQLGRERIGVGRVRP